MKKLIAIATIAFSGSVFAGNLSEAQCMMSARLAQGVMGTWQNGGNTKEDLYRMADENFWGWQNKRAKELIDQAVKVPVVEEDKKHETISNFVDATLEECL